MGEEAENAKPIIEADDDNAFLCQRRAIDGGAGRRTELKTAAMHPHHDRTFLGRAIRCGPNVEIKTILAAWSWFAIFLER